MLHYTCVACIVWLLCERHLQRRVSIVQTHIFCYNISIQHTFYIWRYETSWTMKRYRKGFRLSPGLRRHVYLLIVTDVSKKPSSSATLKNRGRMRDFRFPPRGISDFVRVSDFLLGYDAMCTYWLLPTFRRNLPPLVHLKTEAGWEISDFRREVYENCALLGYYAASSGNFFPAFRDNISVPSSWVRNTLPLKVWPDMLTRNFGKKLQLLTA